MGDLKMQVDPHLKRLACQIYTQLPEDNREAMQVLNFVRQIIFCLGEDWETVMRSAPILPFSTDQKGRAGYPRVVREAPHDHPDTTNQE